MCELPPAGLSSSISLWLVAKVLSMTSHVINVPKPVKSRKLLDHRLDRL